MLSTFGCKQVALTFEVAKPVAVAVDVAGKRARPVALAETTDVVGVDVADSASGFERLAD